MKNDSISKRRIGIALTVAACLMIALGGVYLFRQYRLRRLIAQWRYDGLAQDKAGDYAGAVGYLTGYLNLHSDDQEALAAFIDARPHVPSDDHAEIAQTISALRNLVQLNPAAVDRRAQLLDLYAKVDAQTEVIETADAILQSDPSNSKAFDAKSQAQINLKSYKDALATCQVWQKAIPLSVQAQTRAIALQGQLSTPVDQILAGIDAGSKQHPDQPARTEFYQAIAYAATGDSDHCRTLLLAAAARTPHDDDLDEALVRQLGAYGKSGEDVAVLQQLVQAGAGAKCRQMLVQRLWEMGQTQQAVDTAKGLNLNDDSISSDVLGMLALSYEGLGQPSDSDSMKGLLWRRHDSVSSAWVEIIGSQNANDWKTNQAVAAATRRALVSDPGNGYVTFYLGNALANLGENELSLEAWRRAAGVRPTWGAPFTRMVQPLSEQGDIIGAAQAAVDGLHRTPTAAAALAVVRSFLALDENGITANRDAAMQLIDQLSKLTPGSEELVQLRAAFLCRAGQNGQAADLIQNTLSAQPAPSESLLLSLAATSRENGFNLEDRIFDADQKLHGITPNLAVNRAVAEAGKTGQANGLALFDQLQSQSAEKSATLWEIARAQCLLSIGSPLAKSAWVDLGGQFPDDLSIQLQVLRSGALNSDRQAVLAVISRLRKILGDNSLLCDLQQAQILVATRSGDSDDRDITELLSRIIAMHPSMVQARILWAQALGSEGRIDDAINQLQLAAKIDPISVSIALQLASLEQIQGDYDAAREQLNRAANLNAANGEQTFLMAKLRESLGDIPGAIALLEKLTARTAQQDISLADLYGQVGRLGEANAIVARLMKTPTPEILNFAARFYAVTGQGPLGQSALEQLGAMKVPEPESIIAQANYDLAAGNGDKAVTLLADGTGKFPRDARLWRLRAVTLFLSADPADALPILDQGLAAMPSDPVLSALKDAGADLAVAINVPDIRPIARGFLDSPANQPAALDVIRVVAQVNKATDPKDYVSAVQGLSQRYPRIEGVQLWSVRMYLRAGRYHDAGAVVSRLLEAFPSSVDAAAMATAYYEARNSWSDALSAAQAWRALSKPGGPADIAAAHAMIGLGRASEAVTQLQPFAADAIANPDANSQLLLTYSEALYTSGATHQSADLLLPLTHDKSEWRQAALRFVSQKLNGVDGQQWLSQIAPSIDRKSSDEMASIAEAWEVMSARSDANRDECQKNAQALFDEIAAMPDATAMALTRAGVYRERSQQVDAAIALYRRALKLDPSQPICRNNLAILLAANPSGVQEALILAHSLNESDPNDPEILDTLSFVQAKAGEINAAVADLKQASDLAPEEMRFQVELARLLADNRRKQEASGVLASIEASGADLTGLPPEQQHDLEQLRADLTPPPGSHGPTP